MFENFINNSQTNEEIVLSSMQKLISDTEWEGKILLVGGAVRDEIMGKKIKDLDFVVNGRDSNAGINFSIWLAKRLGIYVPESNPVIFKRFGTSKISLKNNNLNLPAVELEFVAPRMEQYVQGSRKPTVSHASLEEETLRRDLTINTLMRDISSGKIIDLTGLGVKDIRDGIIRTPTDPNVTFKDDPLRMLRVVRFFTKYGFTIEPNTLRGIKKNAKEIENISAERVQEELNKILVQPNAAKGIKLLKVTGLMDYVLPEFTAAVGMKQNKYHTQDVFAHSLDVLSKTPEDLKTRLIALFHDIGKTLTKTVTPDGSVHFYEHERVGEEMVKKIMKRLKYPNDLIDAVANGVGNHMMLKHGGNDASKLSDKSLRKFVHRVGTNLEHILDVIHADNISHSEAGAMPDQIEQVRKRLETLTAKIDQNKPKLPLDGNDLIKMGVKPGPQIKEIKLAIEEAWYDNPELSRAEAEQIAKTMIENFSK